MSPEEVQREQEALDSITRWASEYAIVHLPASMFSPSLQMRQTDRLRYSQIVEIFPHQHRTLAMSTSQLNGHTNDHTAASAAGAVSSANTHQHQDILLSLIPGDKSKRSIRIYPASRPTSKASLRSNSSMSRLNGAGAGSVKVKNAPVLVTLDVNLP